MKFYYSGLLLLVSANIVLATSAPPRTKVYISELQYWSYEDKGVAIELLKSFDQTFLRKVSLMTLPFKRLGETYKTDLKLGEKPCSLGDSRKNIEKMGFNTDRLYSNPMAISSIVAYTAVRQPVVNSWNELRKMSVGIVRGSLHTGHLRENGVTQITEANSLESLFSMLRLNRLGAVVSYYPETNYLLENIYFDPDFEIDRTLDTFHCENSPENKELVSLFNQQLTKAIENGTYESVLGKYWQVTPRYLEIIKALNKSL